MPSAAKVYIEFFPPYNRWEDHSIKGQTIRSHDTYNSHASYMTTGSHTVGDSPPLTNAERISLEFTTLFSGKDELTGSIEMSFQPLLWPSSNGPEDDRELQRVFIPTLQLYSDTTTEEIVQFADVMVETWESMHQSWKEDEPKMTIMMRLLIASSVKKRSIALRAGDDSGADQNALSEDLERAQLEWDQVFTGRIREELKTQIMPLFPLDSDDSVGGSEGDNNREDN